MKPMCGSINADQTVTNGRGTSLKKPSLNRNAATDEQLLNSELALTHLVTVEIFTPNTPIGFRDGIFFRLNSRLVNFMDSFTSI